MKKQWKPYIAKYPYTNPLCEQNKERRLDRWLFWRWLIKAIRAITVSLYPVCGISGCDDHVGVKDTCSRSPKD